ncbi:hypothetical protein BAUCODRAFT_152774 [Baudoinia panamericana UAMH 10762]|uniref:Uncharacterized protein n=1 Tax=Baudoinia panamericana (strain UAMH 10762) TaxID=717646 RepID=M2LAR0_BAUPA|nr:uncharacterized protein BAUCODRAFT_152774 [Baudoinia panamericana UAMH 10762]EMC90902.1 hypothetical protein BAUCODRAFT_152774 [Baudoinia panamericana UAMH 10762]
METGLAYSSQEAGLHLLRVLQQPYPHSTYLTTLPTITSHPSLLLTHGAYISAHFLTLTKPLTTCLLAARILPVPPPATDLARLAARTHALLRATARDTIALFAQLDEAGKTCKGQTRVVLRLLEEWHVLYPARAPAWEWLPLLFKGTVGRACAWAGRQERAHVRH